MCVTGLEFSCFQSISCHYASTECHYIDVTGTSQQYLEDEIKDLVRTRMSKMGNDKDAMNDLASRLKMQVTSFSPPKLQGSVFVKIQVERSCSAYGRGGPLSLTLCIISVAPVHTKSGVIRLYDAQ